MTARINEERKTDIWGDDRGTCSRRWVRRGVQTEEGSEGSRMIKDELVPCRGITPRSNAKRKDGYRKKRLLHRNIYESSSQNRRGKTAGGAGKKTWLMRGP